MTRGQAQLGVIAATSLIAFAASWLGGYVLNSPKDAAIAATALTERLARVEVNDKNQDNNINDLRADVKHIRDILDQWAQRQGISIKQ